MNEKYKQLFTELAHSLELITERAMEDEKEPKSLETVTAMRENYMQIYDKLRDNKVMQLTLSDFAHLYIAAGILLNHLNEQKQSIEAAIKGYNIDVLPKLNRILNETKDDFSAIKLAKELFSIEESKPNN